LTETLFLLQRCPLFAGIGENELEKLLACLSVRHSGFEKGNYIFSAGDKPKSVGIVLSGCIHIVRDDFWGKRTIVERLEPPALFAEAFSCAGLSNLPVSIVAAEKSAILLIDYRKIITVCASSCPVHATLINNMLTDIARKNVMLMQKLEYSTSRTTREKLLAYLSFQAQQQKTGVFEIPFNRQELADYLAVDRSAMSAELGKMRDEGIVRIDKNKFELV
jgi:CRP-like cAMP-binding protein